MGRCAIALCALLAACGYTDAGTGSRTLNVQGSASYHASDNETHVAIALTKNMALLGGATVTMTDADSGEEFVIPEVQHPDENYRSHLDGHHRRLELSIVAGSDELTARIEGPGTFTVPTPEHNSIISLGQVGDTIDVTWRPADGMGADQVRIWLNRADFETTLTEDEGRYEIKTSFLEPGDETLRVERINEVTLEGGTAGSKLSSSYMVGNELVVQ